MWEIWEPIPPPKKETYETDPRVEDAKKRMETIYKVTNSLQFNRCSPLTGFMFTIQMGYEEFKPIHYMAADMPEEDIFFFREV